MLELFLESGDTIKNISKFKVENSILIPIILFGIISVITIFCTKNLLSSEFENYWIKQVVWYGVGFILAYKTSIFKIYIIQFLTIVNMSNHRKSPISSIFADVGDFQVAFLQTEFRSQPGLPKRWLLIIIFI